MDDVSVFVCIPGQDGERWLRRCLDPVVSQNVGSLEVVLMDDESTDGTLRIMRDVEVGTYEFRTMREDRYDRSPYSGAVDARRVPRDCFCGVGVPVSSWPRWFGRDLLAERVSPKDTSLHEDAHASARRVARTCRDALPHGCTGR